MDITAIRAFCADVKKVLEAKGYDDVSFPRFEVSEEGCRLTIYAFDEFQDRVDDKVHNGYMTFNDECNNETTFHTILNKVRAIPNRERRELMVLLRQCAMINGMEEKMQTLSGKAFASEIAERAEGYNFLLENLQ